jgi:hypothetical protein
MPQTAVIGGIAFDHLIHAFEPMVSKNDDVNDGGSDFFPSMTENSI